MDSAIKTTWMSGVTPGSSSANMVVPVKSGGHLTLADRKAHWAQPRDLRLLPLLHRYDQLPPATVVLGQAMNGSPLLFTPASAGPGHLLISGPRRTGKSELIRTALLSLCLTSRPARVCVLGVDLGGRELAVLDAMPHALSDLATEPNYAGALLHWLAEERERRVAYAIRRPSIVLLMDDLAWLDRPARRAEAHILSELLQSGAEAGIHLFAASLDPLPVRFQLPVGADTVIKLSTFSASDGRIVVRRGGERVPARAVWSSAHDLNTAAGLAQAGWRASRRFLTAAPASTRQS